MKPSSLIAAFNRLTPWPRLRVWDFTVVAPTFDRWLYLWLHRFGRMGGDEAACFTRLLRPGMHVADVGANIGLYSLWLARCVGPAGRVYAFEPDALMADALRRNLAANGAGTAPSEVFEYAVGAASGEAVLQRNSMNSGDNRLGLNTGTAMHDAQAAVRVCALQDALQGRRVDFVKMDVQGWEGEALRGITGLLDANPGLWIHFEYWPHGLRRAGTEIPQFAAMLRSLGLRVTLADAGADASEVDLEALARDLPEKSFINLLARR